MVWTKKNTLGKSVQKNHNLGWPKLKFHSAKSVPFEKTIKKIKREWNDFWSLIVWLMWRCSGFSTDHCIMWRTSVVFFLQPLLLFCFWFVSGCTTFRPTKTTLLNLVTRRFRDGPTVVCPTHLDIMWHGRKCLWRAIWPINCFWDNRKFLLF